MGVKFTMPIQVSVSISDAERCRRDQVSFLTVTLSRNQQRNQH